MFALVSVLLMPQGVFGGPASWPPRAFLNYTEEAKPLEIWPSSATRWYLSPNCRIPVPGSCSDLGSFSCLGASFNDGKYWLRNNGSPSFEAYEGLAGLPHCWSLLRKLLCTVNVIPCHNGSGRLIPRGQCEKVRTHCQFLVDHNLWPEQLGNCTDPTIFNNACTIDYAFPIWDDTHAEPRNCVKPLAFSLKSDDWVIPYCALNCTDQWLSTVDHLLFGSTVWHFAPTAFALSLIMLISQFTGIFEAPAYFKPLLADVCCRAVILLCWIFPLNTDLKQIIICNNGTLRQREGLYLRSFPLCVVQFALLYATRFMAICWLAVFFYHQYTFSSAPDERTQSRYDKRASTLNFVVFFVPILISIALAGFFNVADADGITGICFVGLQNPLRTIILYYLPTSLAVLAWVTFYALAVRRRLACPRTLYYPKFSTFKLSLMFVCHITAYCFGLFYHWREMLIFDEKKRVLMDYIVCQLGTSRTSLNGCTLNYKSSLLLVQIYALMDFMPAIINCVVLMTSAKFTPEKSRLLRRFYKPMDTSESEKEFCLNEVPARNCISEDGHLPLCMSTMLDSDSCHTGKCSVRQPRRSNKEFCKRFRLRGNLSYLRRQNSYGSSSGVMAPSFRSCSLPSNLQIGRSLPSLPFGDPSRVASQVASPNYAIPGVWPAYAPCYPPFCPPVWPAGFPMSPAMANAFLPFYYQWVNWMQMNNLGQGSSAANVNGAAADDGSSKVDKRKKTFSEDHGSADEKENILSDADDSDSEKFDPEEEAFVEQQLLALRSRNTN
uniref:Frizzled domain-containing protein n=1 Tax=Trichuris muris TaxID=70415 RepID=A0A5S6Q4W5_TRIMR